MARLLSAVSAAFSTDSAMVTAAQSGCGGPDAGGLVGSVPGSIAGMCGTKYADVLVRPERWDAGPPQQLGREDGDELATTGVRLVPGEVLVGATLQPRSAPGGWCVGPGAARATAGARDQAQAQPPGTVGRRHVQAAGGPRDDTQVLEGHPRLEQQVRQHR